MKLLRVICCVFVLLLSLVAFAFSTSAHAAASRSPIMFTLHGLSAVANFDSLSPDGCIDTFVGVAGTQSSSGTSPVADVFISQFNNCTNTQLLSAFGMTSNPTFQISNSLDSASLSATISVLNLMSGNTFNVSVSTTWTATGPISHQIGTTISQNRSFIEIFHFNDASRGAGASGTVSNGTINFTPFPTMFAQIASFKTGTVIISLP